MPDSHDSTTSRRPAWLALADEDSALEILILRDRIADLQADVRIYREIATAGVHALHAITRERDRLRTDVRELRTDLKFLREGERRAA
jgi:hypothetical protein